MSKPKTLETIAAANGVATDAAIGAVTPPIVLSSAFTFVGFHQPRAAPQASAMVFYGFRLALKRKAISTPMSLSTGGRPSTSRDLGF